MKDCLERELEKTTKDKEKFVSEFSSDDFDYLVSGWQVSHIISQSLNAQFYACILF